MSTITHTTDPSELDLSEDWEFNERIARREELEKAIEALRVAEKERKEIDAEIVARLGNASSARLANGAVVAIKVVHRKEAVIPASSWTRVSVRGWPKKHHFVMPRG